MKRVHLSETSQLLRALIVLQEDGAGERVRQEKMSNRLKRRKMNEKDEEEEKEKEKSDSKEEKPSEEEPEKKQKDSSDSKDDDKLPGAERLENSVLPPGSSPSSKDIAQRVNFIRAGASLKDPEIQRKIAVWISQLRNPERMAAYTTLDALAQIVLGGKSPAEAPTFEDPANLTIKGGPESSAPVKQTKKPASQDGKQDGTVPITVGESVVKKLKEVDVPVKSGKVVPFGSKAHIADLEDRIDDLRRIRSYQQRGSDSHHTLGAAITALKRQLTAAQRRSTDGNPRTQPVPPMVEKQK